MQGFSQSSEDIRLENDGRKLTCRPKTRDGGFRERQGIDLDRIYNDNGRLVYRKLALVPFESVGVARIDCF